MEAFDPKAYERDVIKPLRRRGGGLPTDLLERYAIDSGFSDEQLQRRLREVRSHWNKSAQSAAKPDAIKRIYQDLLREDEKLRGAPGNRMDVMSWWVQQHRSRAAYNEAQIVELVDMLEASYGDLGLITPGQLDAMRDTFGSLASSEIDEALRRAEVHEARPLELPKTSGLSTTLFERLERLLRAAEVRSIPELLHGKLQSFEILGGFSSTPPASTGLTAQAVADAVKRENRRSGNQAAREALGLLRTTAKQSDLRQLAVYHVLDGVRRLRGEAPPGALLRKMRETGLVENEARQAVVSVLGEPGAPEREASDLAEVTDLLAAGQLAAAQRALVEITDAEQAASAKAAVEQQIERVRKLRSEAHRAAQAGDDGAARAGLVEAMRLAADDDALAAELRRIPVNPVGELAVRPEGSGVRVSWRARPDHTEETRYRVRRCPGRVPQDPDDGDLVEECRATALIDNAVAVGQSIGYAVFAAVSGGVWSRPAEAIIEVCPPVHRASLVVCGGVLTGTWQTHPDVVGVRVERRGDSGRAETVPIPGNTSFRDPAADPHSDWTYLLTARYRRPDGREVESETVSLRHTARPVPTLPPVIALESRVFGSSAVLSWVWPDGVRIVEVTWTNQATGGGTRRLTRQQYQSEGGCRIDTGPGTAQVQVCSVDAGATARSEPCSLPVTVSSAMRIDYRVQRRGGLLGARTARIVMSSEGPVAECEVLVVVAPGRSMPLRPEDGDVVHRGTYPIDQPLELTVDLPVRRPYWLRCFVPTPGIDLVDPPTAQLKVT